MQVEGVILVAHDQDGNVTVVDTGDRVGRKGAGVGLVGLFAPASVVVGAAGGAVVGRFVGHQLKAGTTKKVVFDLYPGPHEREKMLLQTVRHGARAAAVSR